MTALPVAFAAHASPALWAAVCWADALGLPDDHALAEPTHYGPRGYVNFVACRLDKSPMGLWRHLSSEGLKSPRIGYGELVRHWQWSSGAKAPPAYAILPGSSGLVVVDVDDPALVPDMLALYGDTPIRTRTPSGGMHLYYLAPADNSPEAEAVGGVAHVSSRTAVRGPGSYDVKAAGAMCHAPGGASLVGDYTSDHAGHRYEPGELRAMLPTFPLEKYEADWLAHHPGADWEPEGQRADDFILAPHDMVLVNFTTGECAAALDTWGDLIDFIGPAIPGERHDKARRLALNLGDRACPEADALELMREWNAANPSPESDEWVRAHVRDAYRTRRSALGCKVRLPEDFTIEDEAESEPEAAANAAPVTTAPATGVQDVDPRDLFGGVPAAAEVVEAVAGALNRVPDMPAVFSLTMMSAAIAGKAVLQVDPDYEPVPLFLHQILEAPAGYGKSQALKMLGVRLFDEHEDRLRASVELAVSRAAVLRGELEDERSDLQRALKAAKKAQKEAALLDEMRDRLAQIDLELKHPAPGLPLYVAASITPAAFHAKMAAARFVFAVAGEGAAVIRNFVTPTGDGGAGRDHLDGLLASHSGERLRDETISRGALAPIMRGVFLLPLQPGILSPISEVEAKLLQQLSSRGLFARMMIARPRLLPSGVAAPRVPPEEMARRQRAWETLLRGLLEAVPGQDHPLAPANPVVLTCTDAARRRLLAFKDRMSGHGKPGGQWADNAALVDVAERLGEQAFRIAGVLRLGRAGQVVACQVEEEDAIRAIRHVEQYVTPHAIEAAARAVFDPVDDDAARVLQVLREKGPTIKLSAFLDTHFKRGWSQQRNERRSRFEAAVGHLIARGLVAMTGGERGQGERAYTLINRAAVKVAA